MLRDVVEISVCTDCLFWIEYGTVPEDGTGEYDTPGIPPMAWVGAGGDDSDEHVFSSARCDACHTTLGGYRHAAHYFIQPGDQ
jgi:hypothetical protein